MQATPRKSAAQQASDEAVWQSVHEAHRRLRRQETKRTLFFVFVVIPIGTVLAALLWAWLNA
jgi:hypothetical protein